MGFMDTIKGWLNIGGVKVEITDCKNPYPRDETHMTGKYTLTSKSPKTILSTNIEFRAEKKVKKNGEEKTEKTILARFNSKKQGGSVEYPFDLAAGETREFPIDLVTSDLEDAMDKLGKQGGMLGAMGKAAAFAGKMGSDLRYYLEVEVDVKGAALDPSDRVEIKVVTPK